MNRNKIIASIVVLLTVSILLIASVQPTSAQFALASWEYPDEYWNGISGINIYENSTGAWVVKYGTIEPDDDDSTIFDWNASIAIKLRVWVTLNSTLVGVSTTDDGKNYIRHSVLVMCLGETIFSQQNFTYYGVSTEAEIYTYSYDVVLDFLPVSGAIYKVTVTYEIWW